MKLLMPELIPSHRPDLRAAIEAMPSSKLIGLRILGFGDGVSAIEMAVKPELTFDGRIVQGGLVGVLADYGAVSAANAAMPVGWASSTTSFQVYNIAPAKGDRLVALGRLIKASKSQAFAAADVYAMQGEEAELIATSLATCRLFQVS